METYGFFINYVNLTLNSSSKQIFTYRFYDDIYDLQRKQFGIILNILVKIDLLSYFGDYILTSSFPGNSGPGWLIELGSWIT